MISRTNRGSRSSRSISFLSWQVIVHSGYSPTGILIWSLRNEPPERLFPWKYDCIISKPNSCIIYDLIGEGTGERTETVDEYFSLRSCFRPLLRRNSYVDRLSTSDSEASSDVPSWVRMVECQQSRDNWEFKLHVGIIVNGSRCIEIDILDNESIIYTFLT